MKKIENNFAVTGFVVKDAEIREFKTASVARFPIAISQKGQGENERTSALISAEAWRKNESKETFNVIKKNTLLTIEGYFKPEEWEDEQKNKHSKVILCVTKFYPAKDKEETPKTEEKKAKK